MRCSPAIRAGALFVIVSSIGLMALPGPIQGQAIKKGKKYALLVGVNTYEHEDLRPLKYTENDVEELAKLLRKPSAGFAGVRVLTVSRGKKDPKDLPTAANIRKAIAEMTKIATGQDLILLALSGHGVELSVSDPDNKGPDKDYHYFCPSDANLNEISYADGKHDKLLHLKLDVFLRLGNCAGRKVILIDACRNELNAKAATRTIDVRKIREIHEDLAVLFSCRSGQKSWETEKLGHGVFFYHILEGLKGKATKNAKNEITWINLLAHIEAQMTDEYMQSLIGGGARQSPHGLGSIVGALPLLTLDPVPLPLDKPAADKEKGFTNSVGMKLVLIPQGEGAIGSPLAEVGRVAGEIQQAVTIPQAFYMGVHEVTQDEYQQVMGKNPSHFSSEGKGKATVAKMLTGKFPVENVSCVEAKAFCDKLTAREREKGRVYRLPTEAEWEYACRAGTKTATHSGDALSSELANFDGNFPYNGAKKGPNLARTCPVGSYKPNAWGLHDMHGNVWEWTSTEAAKGSGSRITRGGCWADPGASVRSARRFRLFEKASDAHTGFRVICETPGR